MDDSKRRELAERRAAMKVRQQAHRREDDELFLRTALAPILEALETAGDAFERIETRALNGSWIPDWVPWGYSTMPWHLAPRARMVDWWNDIPRRDRAAAAFLDELADDATPVLIMYEDYRITLRMTKQAALRHLPAALAAMPDHNDIWLTSPPADWLIRVDPTGRLHAYESVPPTPDELAATHRARRAGRAVIRPQLTGLAAAGVRYRLIYPRDPAFAHWPGPGLPRPQWRDIAESLRIDIRTDPAARDTEAAAFVAARPCPEGRLKFQLNIEPTSTVLVPAIEIRCSAFAATPGAVLDALGAPLWFWAPGAPWFVEVGPVLMRGQG